MAKRTTNLQYPCWRAGSRGRCAAAQWCGRRVRSPPPPYPGGGCVRCPCPCAPHTTRVPITLPFCPLITGAARNGRAPPPYHTAASVAASPTPYFWGTRCRPPAFSPILLHPAIPARTRHNTPRAGIVREAVAVRGGGREVSAVRWAAWRVGCGMPRWGVSGGGARLCGAAGFAGGCRVRGYGCCGNAAGIRAVHMPRTRRRRTRSHPLHPALVCSPVKFM